MKAGIIAQATEAARIEAAQLTADIIAKAEDAARV